MGYSEDIVIGIRYSDINRKGQAKAKHKLTFIKKHKWITTICVFSGILIVFDVILIYNFINLLQNIV